MDIWREELSSALTRNDKEFLQHNFWLDNTQRLMAITAFCHTRAFTKTDIEFDTIEKVCRKVTVNFPNPNFKNHESLTELGKKNVKFLEENLCCFDPTNLFDDCIIRCIQKVEKAVHEKKYLPGIMGQFKNYVLSE